MEAGVLQRRVERAQPIASPPAEAESSARLGLDAAAAAAAVQARHDGLPRRLHVAFDVAFHALLAGANPPRRQEQLEHGLQARYELPHQADPAAAAACLARRRRRRCFAVAVVVSVVVGGEDEVEGDAVAQQAAEVAHPEADARVHFATLWHPPRVVRPYERRPEVAPAAPGRVHQRGERGLGGDRDRMRGAPGEEPREDRERLRHRDVHVERREQLRRGAPERGHGAGHRQHRSGARGRQLPHSDHLRGHELLVPKAEHVLHGAQRLRPRPHPPPDLPPREETTTTTVLAAAAQRARVQHPSGVEPGEPARQGVCARAGPGGRGEGREEGEHALLVPVDVVEHAGGRLGHGHQLAASAVVGLVAGGGGGGAVVLEQEHGYARVRVGAELVGVAAAGGAVAIRGARARGRRRAAATAAAAVVVAAGAAEPAAVLHLDGERACKMRAPQQVASSSSEAREVYMSTHAATGSVYRVPLLRWIVFSAADQLCSCVVSQRKQWPWH
ncbi:hypothetical protein BDA96_10G078000 [Sorghum bicolor]|uniref:Uncharacterized protein n=1 Tax=Sorghum bicolor TaxID=4558 RepID=A0A921TZI5_SORBI|nr:hypothetical protein BDA96_10G078000 [Sorghum bicolor]